MGFDIYEIKGGKTMKKNLKFIIPGVCVIVVAITFFMLFDIKSKVEKGNYPKNNENEIMFEEEKVLEEDTSETTEEENHIVEEQNQQNISITNDVATHPEATGTSTNTSQTGNASSIAYEDDSDNGSTEKKEQAIALVKEKWGEDDTVSFRCDSVNEQGEYIIAVISKASAIVKNYFKVNLESKTVEVDY